MHLVFNEASDNFEPPSEEVGKAWLEEFMEICIQFHKRRHIKKFQVISLIPFSRLKIFNKVVIEKWLDEFKGNPVRRSIALSIIKSAQAEVSFPPYYYYSDGSTQTEAKGIGYAIEKNGFAIGYSCADWPKPPIDILKHSQYDIKTLRFERHLTCVHDVSHFFPVRKFEHHLKHDRKRLNLNDGESTLDYNPSSPKDLELIQELLDYAINWGNGLCNYDSNKRAYIVFNAHGFNKYHGYHIEIEKVPDQIKTACREVVLKMKAI